MVLGYLLARSGADVVVLEKHSDFLRDFRGDTVHPSTLQVLQECGLLETFDRIPQQKVQHLTVRIGSDVQSVIDFQGLKPFNYLAFVPQWDFLDMLADECGQYHNFTLLMEHEVTDLIVDNNRVKGVKAAHPTGVLSVYANLVVGCDGRDSVVRRCTGLKVIDLGAPMDALWFKLPRTPDDLDDTFAILGAGNMMVLLNRNEYWQVAYVVPKGSDSSLRERSIAEFRDSIVSLAPFLEKDAGSLESWDEVKTLVVKVNRLKQWCKEGVLLIGDAAHAMSPIGGVGINLAVQDAVAAANIIAGAMKQGAPIDVKLLRQVQGRREMPTKLIQWMQTTLQKRVVSNTLEKVNRPPEIPAVLRWLLHFRWIRNIPARIIGYGFRREHANVKNFL